MNESGSEGTRKALLVLVMLQLLVGCQPRDEPRPLEVANTGGVSQPTLVDAAERAMTAELEALRAYAREKCQECPEEAPQFLAGSHYAFQKAVDMDSTSYSANFGLSRVELSSAFIADGQPVDSILHSAMRHAQRARRFARGDAQRTRADSLIAQITRSK
jgi:hypothetical protein